MANEKSMRNFSVHGNLDKHRLVIYVIEFVPRSCVARISNQINYILLGANRSPETGTIVFYVSDIKLIIIAQTDYASGTNMDTSKMRNMVDYVVFLMLTSSKVFVHN